MYVRSRTYLKLQDTGTKELELSNPVIGLERRENYAHVNNLTFILTFMLFLTIGPKITHTSNGKTCRNTLGQVQTQDLLT